LVGSDSVYHRQRNETRPVLILWQDGNDFVVSAVTSAASRSRTDVIRSDWSAAGLRVASVVRLSRLDCLESILMRRKLGTISRADGQALKMVWANEIHLQF
jgi:mRNA interferase MazF